MFPIGPSFVPFPFTLSSYYFSFQYKCEFVWFSFALVALRIKPRAGLMNGKCLLLRGIHSFNCGQMDPAIALSKYSSLCPP